MAYIVVGIMILGLYLFFRDSLEPSIAEKVAAKLERSESQTTEQNNSDSDSMVPILPVRIGRAMSTLQYADINRDTPTIFLDIDGVCHRNLNESFERIPLLESFLTTHHCQIVISSTWRETCDEAYLASALGETVWSCVVGFTPKLPFCEGVYHRQSEVETFAGYFGLQYFIALDDDRYEFGHDAKVHFTNKKTGLVRSDIQKLIDWYYKLLSF